MSKPVRHGPCVPNPGRHAMSLGQRWPLFQRATDPAGCEQVRAGPLPRERLYKQTAYALSWRSQSPLQTETKGRYPMLNPGIAASEIIKVKGPLCDTGSAAGVPSATVVAITGRDLEGGGAGGTRRSSERKKTPWRRWRSPRRDLFGARSPTVSCPFPESSVFIRASISTASQIAGSL
ncbi:hypothetical protein SKAU_G00345660 [Synaphobranchus kaupii]|uniref:Uncharacterized protein n=1 Tax=Synaphobranchus kaupii TaxID=118154 RepID=A0A9Q1EJL7_SYNKA|nr:hypothetical protein SKAU_G00345660 [Synaphobranchus kaupii]